MTKKVLLLFAKVSVETGYADPAALAALLQQADPELAVHTAFLEELTYFIDGKRIEVRDTNDHLISDYDVVYFRYWGQSQGCAIAAARYCKLTNTPFVDSEVLRVGSQNKITQYVNLHEAGVPIPKTFIGAITALQGHYQEYGFTFPCIVKSVGGTRGQDNYLVHNEDELRAIGEQHPGILFVMQAFIPNNGDYRVVVMGNEVVLVIERQAMGESHLNNTSQGGSARIVPPETLPIEVREQCVRASQFFGRDIAGVDMVRSLDDDRYYCFEVNRSPQIDHATFADEKAALLARYLKAKSK